MRWKGGKRTNRNVRKRFKSKFFRIHRERDILNYPFFFFAAKTPPIMEHIMKVEVITMGFYKHVDSEAYITHDILGELRLIANENDSFFRRMSTTTIETKLKFYNFNEYDIRDIMEKVKDLVWQSTLDDRLYIVYENVMPLVYKGLATY